MYLKSVFMLCSSHSIVENSHNMTQISKHEANKEHQPSSVICDVKSHLGAGGSNRLDTCTTYLIRELHIFGS
jgi:hypothetical protein